MNPCSGGLYVLLHNFFETNWDDPYVTGIAVVSFKSRGIIDEFTGELTGQTVTCWDWDEIDEIHAEEAKSTLSDWHEYQDATWEITPLDYYTIPDDTRAKCFSATPPPAPSPSPTYFGTASPPPPRRKMCGCDCNTIASIIAEHMAEKQRLLDAIKGHVDTRAVEQLKHINKMLQDIDMDLDLQPVIDEVKRVEKNLWNGINGG